VVGRLAAEGLTGSIAGCPSGQRRAMFSLALAKCC